jgi:tRNA modification GTPase
LEFLLENDDTIAAVATGLGGAGIGIIRISGNNAVKIGNQIFANPSGKTLIEARSHELLYGKIIDSATGRDIDEVLISKMKAPHSYTAEDVVEINCHGGIVPMRKILKLVVASGARLAEAGEFTKRAFLNGRLDLSQAEAVIDIINAKTEKSLEYSVAQLEGQLSKKLDVLDEVLLGILSHMEVNIDYPEYDIEEVSISFVSTQLQELIKKIEDILVVAETGKIYREGISTAILGEPNVGKSSLLNALLLEEKAIVTDIPGTTRDIIEEYINIEGIPFKIIDTAGIRETENLVEQIGVEKSKALLNQANLIIFMRDISKEISQGEEELMALLKNRRVIYIANKTDTLDSKSVVITEPWIPMSLYTDSGIDRLRKKMLEMVFEGSVNQDADYLITNTRHIQLLEKTRDSLKNAILTINNQMPLELVSIDVMEALEALRGITGKSIGMDIIDQIFKNFCIGK